MRATIPAEARELRGSVMASPRRGVPTGGTLRRVRGTLRPRGADPALDDSPRLASCARTGRSDVSWMPCSGLRGTTVGATFALAVRGDRYGVLKREISTNGATRSTHVASLLAKRSEVPRDRGDRRSARVGPRRPPCSAAVFVYMARRTPTPAPNVPGWAARRRVVPFALGSAPEEAITRRCGTGASVRDTTTLRHRAVRIPSHPWCGTSAVIARGAVQFVGRGRDPDACGVRRADRTRSDLHGFIGHRGRIVRIERETR